MRKQKREAALLIAKQVASAQRRSLMSSWHSWRLHLATQASYSRLIEHQRAGKIRSLYRVMRRFNVRQAQGAWRAWTRGCAVAAHRHDLHSAAQKAQVAAVIFLEQMCERRAERQLQSAWGAWRQRTHYAQVKELQQVRARAFDHET